MPEPTASAAAAVTIAATSAAIPVISAFGVPLGLRVDFLVAGLLGSLVGIVLLNIVPGSSDTWREFLRLTGRRMAVAVASSITAGYSTPLILLLPLSMKIPDSLVLNCAFIVGASAQYALTSLIRRFSPPTPPAAPAMEGQQ